MARQRAQTCLLLWQPWRRAPWQETHLTSSLELLLRGCVLLPWAGLHQAAGALQCLSSCCMSASISGIQHMTWQTALLMPLNLWLVRALQA